MWWTILLACNDPTPEPGCEARFRDADGDGFGNPARAVASCDEGVEDSTDCDDADATVHPGAVEVCDGLDNDCDEGTSEAGIARWVPIEGPVEDWSEKLAGQVELGEPGTLHVCAGVWEVNLAVSASVIVEGHDAVLDGVGAGSVVHVLGEDLDVVLDGLTMQGGEATAGGGIYASLGGVEASLSLRDVVVQDNRAEARGGGLWLGSGEGTAASFLIEDSLIAGNSAEDGAGLHLQGPEAGIDVVLRNTRIRGNTAEDLGGALSSYWGGPSRVTLEDSWIQGNTARVGAAAYTTSGGLQLRCVDSVVASNDSTGGGWVGAIYEEDPNWSEEILPLITSEGCHWGSGDEDNVGVDVIACATGNAGGEGYCKYRYYLFADQDFSCVDGLCGVEHAEALEPTGDTLDGTFLAVGNVFEPEGTPTIERLSLYAASTDDTGVNFYLLALDAETERWTVEAYVSATRPDEDPGGWESAVLGRPLRADTTYAVVAGFYTFQTEITVSPYVAEDGAQLEVFGPVLGSWRDDGYTHGYGGVGSAVEDHSTGDVTSLALGVTWRAP